MGMKNPMQMVLFVLHVTAQGFESFYLHTWLLLVLCNYKPVDSSTSTTTTFSNIDKVAQVNQCHFGGKNEIAVVILLRVFARMSSW